MADVDRLEPGVDSTYDLTGAPVVDAETGQKGQAPLLDFWRRLME